MSSNPFASLLASEIWANPKFQSDLAELTRHVVVRSMGRTPAPLDDVMLRRLIRSAPTLALSDRPEIGEASYRIASSLHGLLAETYPGLQSLLSLILGRRGNFPAIDLMMPEAERSLPPTLLTEALNRRAANTVEVSGNYRSLTDFQVIIWNDLREGRSVAVSAPTSAGKSFVFRAYIEAAVHERPNLVSVLVVPTRALINQMQDQLRPPIERRGGRVVSLPRPLQQAPGPLCYVLTQERLEVLLDEAPDFAADLILVDEAQSVGEDGRGVILQSVVDELLARRPAAQVLFTLPMATNAGMLGRLFEVKKFVERETVESPVGQTVVLLSVDTVKLDTVHASVWRPDRAIPVGDLKMPLPLTSTEHRLAHLAHEFGRHEPSIVYADAQRQCETIANMLTELAENDGEVSPELSQLSLFVKAHVHEKYSLAETVQHGIGFHYGYIPSLVRKEIEHAFDEGHLRFIVCTTTLLKGVNLPARNIFMTKPKVGNKHMLPTDFWNLAGRAGRLGREFDGNVFLVDYEQWKPKPLAEDRRTEVAPTMKRVLNKASEFISFVEGGPAPHGEKVIMENAFARLYRDQQTGRLERTLARMELPSATAAGVTAALKKAADELALPMELLTANPWVSPRRQADLLKWSRDKLKDPANIPDLMPPHPWADDAYSRLAKMMRRCHRELEGLKDQSFLYFANLGLSWMRGKTIPNIIDDIETYKNERKEEYDLPKLIRKVLENIEKDLRFRYVRLFSCYNSVLSYTLAEAGQADSAEHVPALPLYLEMGASSDTMLSFMELGLSRITARLLQDRAAKTDMDTPAAKRWLIRRQSIIEQLPKACQREIASVLKA